MSVHLKLLIKKMHPQGHKVIHYEKTIDVNCADALPMMEQELIAGALEKVLLDTVARLDEYVASNKNQA